MVSDNIQSVEALYRHTKRLTTRGGVLNRNKSRGFDVHARVCDFIAGERRALPAAFDYLDVGAGRGSLVREVKETFNDAQVCALDASEAHVEYIHENVPACSATVGKFEALPYDGDAFDVVSAMFCLYHATDLERVLSELTRVTRPGGVVITATKSRTSYSELDAVVQAVVPGAEVRAGEFYDRFPSERHLESIGPIGELVHQTVDKQEFTFTEETDLLEYIDTVAPYAEVLEEREAKRAVAREIMRRLPFSMTSWLSICAVRLAA